jgi:hypothetical protein
MINRISTTAQSDPKLARLLDDVREYALVYALARLRQKGCDGMGELATVKEEFRDMIDKLMKYCLEQKLIPAVGPYDMDSLADEMQRI